jgi:hypothetical protein
MTKLSLLADMDPFFIIYTMKRKNKQWWSTNSPILTKQTIASHLKSLNITKIMTYGVRNLGLVPLIPAKYYTLVYKDLLHEVCCEKYWIAYWNLK